MLHFTIPKGRVYLLTMTLQATQLFGGYSFGNNFVGDRGSGIGDWGQGTGDRGQGTGDRGQGIAKRLVK
ncbi:hypothetical protein B4U84_20680 [Westiellopsis prolifica IICB1]|nr:hypothetical protein B4U84_20680 [Westiellopsis prolifica IICB1]